MSDNTADLGEMLVATVHCLHCGEVMVPGSSGWSDCTPDWRRWNGVMLALAQLAGLAVGD
jgi:hypothetical protein